MTKRVGFLVVDDHPLFRQGLVALIGSEPDYIVEAEVGSVQEALSFLEKEIPDIILVDISLAGQSGLDLVKTIKISYPKVISLIISMHDEIIYAERALKSGARGYVMKHEAASVMKNAIKTVLSGKIYLSEAMRNRFLESMFTQNEEESRTLVERLSDREFEVLDLMGQGYGVAEIADNFNLSVKTINTHRENIKEKLHISSAGELRRFAIKWVHSRSR
jgi:DNA-binding NarL/FixJ family response regulator